jgi:hypothetical protein
MKRKNREVEGWSQPFGLLLAHASWKSNKFFITNLHFFPFFFDLFDFAVRILFFLPIAYNSLSEFSQKARKRAAKKRRMYADGLVRTHLLAAVTADTSGVSVARGTRFVLKRKSLYRRHGAGLDADAAFFAFPAVYNRPRYNKVFERP